MCRTSTRSARLMPFSDPQNEEIKRLNSLQIEDGSIKRTRISMNVVAAVLLVNALGCSNGKVGAAAPPRLPVVEVAPVIQRDVPVQGEWVGTLEGYVNAQIQPQVS